MNQGYPPPQAKPSKSPGFDLFGITPSLYADGRNKLTSYCGCVLSGFLVLCSLALLVYYGISWFQNENFHFHTRTLTLPVYPAYNLNANQFHVSFIIRENDRYRDYDTEYPTKWFSVNMYSVTVEGTEDETRVPVVTRR